MQPTLTTTDVARILHLNVQTVRRLAAAHRLPGSKGAGGWRFTTADVEAYLDRCRPLPHPSNDEDPHT